MNAKQGLPRAWLGIDPGAKGGAVCLTESGSRICCPFDGLSSIKIFNWFKEAKQLYRLTALLEQSPTAIFGAGKSTSAKLYGSYRELRMILLVLEIPFTEVKPSHGRSGGWLQDVGITKRKKDETTAQWKGRHQKRAQFLLKDKRISKDMCDAFLLGWLCRNKSKS